MLTEELGDERRLKVLHRHNAPIRGHLAAHHGFEVKSQGDGFMVAFGSAGSAIRCAVAIQRDFARRRDQSGPESSASGTLLTARHSGVHTRGLRVAGMQSNCGPST